MHGSYMDFEVYVPVKYRDRTQGFLGNLDGSPDNEFHKKENTDPLLNIVNERQIFDHLDSECKTLYNKVFVLEVHSWLQLTNISDFMQG